MNQRSTWYDAQQHCINLGGKLFSRVNGTVEQLVFLRQKMNEQTHWLGIYTEDHSEWKNTDGEIVPSDLLVWSTGENV